MAESYTPAVVVEFAFGYIGPFTSVPTSAWVDVSAYASVTDPSRGRSSELDLFSASTMTVSLEADDRRFDPLNAAGPYFGNLKPNTPVRVRALHAAVHYPLWYGYADAFRHKPTTFTSTVEVPCTDLFKFLAGKRLPGSVYERTILADAPMIYWRLGESDGSVAADSSGNRRDGTYADRGVERAQGSVLPYSSGGSIRVAAPTERAVRGRSDSFVWERGVSAPFTFEAWVQADVDAMTTLAQDYHLAMQGHTSTADNRWLITYHPLAGGDGELHLDIGAGTPKNTYWFAPKLDDGLPHYVAIGITSAGVPVAYVDGVALSVELSNSIAPPNVPQGLYIGGESLAYPSWVGQIAHVAVYNNADPSGVAADHYALATAPWDGDVASARVTQVLDLIGLPAELRDVVAGEVLLGPADFAGLTVLPYLQLLTHTEQGRLFVAADGKLTFHGNAQTITGTSTYTFASTSGAGIVEDGLLLSLDDTFLYDEAVVQRKYGQPQTAVAAGVTDPMRTFSLDGLLSRDDRHARQLAERLVFRYGTARTRVDGWTTQPERAPADWATILGLDIGDVVTVNLTPAGAGAAVNVKLFIERISHTIDTDDWEVSFYGSPVDDTVYFEWGGPDGSGWGEGCWR